jgi:hypothetical protein
MSKYESLSKRDLIGKLRPLFKSGALYLRDDGKITQDTRPAWDTPWIHQKSAPNRNCGLYHIYYNVFGFIHSRCQECWKVVIRPRTLVELDQLMDIEKRLDLPSKCGIEKRETVCGLYGGYFYNDSLEQGLECYRTVRDAVDKHISPDVTVLLKRACTEFEIEGKMGDSDEWSVSDEQKDMESYLADWVVDDVQKTAQAEHLKDLVFRSWIHWAYQNGDISYLHYTDGKPLFPPYKTYHEVSDGKEEEEEENSSDSTEREDRRRG